MKTDVINSVEYGKPITIRSLSRPAWRRIMKLGEPDGSYESSIGFFKAVLAEGMISPRLSPDELDRFVTIDHHHLARTLTKGIIALTKGK